MPAFFLDTPEILPLPSLQAYTTISVLLLSCSVWYAFQATNEPDWRLNVTTLSATMAAAGTDPILNRTLEDAGGGKEVLILSQSLADVMASVNESTNIHLGFLMDSPVARRCFDMMLYMLREPLCFWTLINMAYCCLILVGKVIQKLVFGELRVSEHQHMKDRFYNYVFYKFIFIFGILNVQTMDDVVLWVSWFSILGFLMLFAQLCGDRFEYLAFSPITPKWTHFKLCSLLATILTTSFLLFLVCVVVGLDAGVNTFAFMAAECLMIFVRTLYITIRYAIHLWDLNHHGVWENRASYAYYTELFFELASLIIDFLHHFHMLIWANIILSVASFIILTQLKSLFSEINRRIRKHKNYLQVVGLMEANFPMVSNEELRKSSDDCAICWDKMEMARKLPCNHLFHNSCLRSWLEQDTSCPTCRTSLKHRTEEDPPDDSNLNNQVDRERDNARPNAGRTNFFHFDGSRYASWLPSVSVEVTRRHPINMGLAENLDNGRALTSSLDDMSRQLAETFPHVAIEAILADLRTTRSMDMTAENILEGRLGAS
ncbi:E3 ubiquitin-protein ligase AMFR-like isoform X2 [Brevipalpus obovatus]|uniref:E3 ubiquitin-protein ligase AMFR-like isoform X2 n=1 Tax=Brevipalpus obovatus TaxID=246614 RepID=UPI003D9E815F